MEILSASLVRNVNIQNILRDLFETLQTVGLEWLSFCGKYRQLYDNYDATTIPLCLCLVSTLHVSKSQVM